MVGEKLSLHFLSDHQFVLELLFFLLFFDQLLQRCRHRIEGVGQSGNLIVRLHWNTMAEVAAIDVCGGVVELGYGAGHGARQAGADDERYHFNDSKRKGDEQQTKFDGLRKITQSGKQTLIDLRHSGLDADPSRTKSAAGVPIHYLHSSSESDLRVYTCCWRRHGS